MPLLALSFALLGIALGSSPGDLRAKLGDPIFIERVSDISRTADYLRADDVSGVLRVTERNGVVFAVEIERERPEPTLGTGDSHGVLLGMSRSTVLAKRGKPAFETENTLLYPEDPAEDASLLYRFDGDVLESIKLLGSGSTAPGNPAAPPLTEAAATSYATAVLDLSPTVFESDHFRERYFTLHACDSAGQSSTVDHRAGRTYEIVRATCGGKTRTYYFDITAARP